MIGLAQVSSGESNQIVVKLKKKDFLVHEGIGSIKETEKTERVLAKLLQRFKLVLRRFKLI
ncbi:hypothetical protein OAS86_05605 [Gammaproteobacteria bacterium]|nr:hypothetical protein [Gammaproteobacteria bacterium]